MYNPRLKDKKALVDLARYGTEARKSIHPDVLIGEHCVKCPPFREGDILDANATVNLIGDTLNCCEVFQTFDEEGQRIAERLDNLEQTQSENYTELSDKVDSLTETHEQDIARLDDKTDNLALNIVNQERVVDISKLSEVDGKTSYLVTKQDGSHDTIIVAKGDKGDQGESFSYEDFTPEQLEALKVKGDKGDKGTSITRVQQTTVAYNDRGVNVITIDLDDGSSSLIQIRNGAGGGDSSQVRQDLQAEIARATSAENALQNNINSVNSRVDHIVEDAPEALDTLLEIAEKLHDEEDAVAALTLEISLKYTKPATGIPSSDMSESVRTSLSKADTALQEHLDISGKADLADLATVATTGEYSDLLNKPVIPTVPTNVSAFTNDAGYLTEHQDISGKQDVISDLDTIRSGAQAGSTALQPSALNDYYNKTQVDTKLGSKQDTISNLATIEAGAAKGATSLQPSDKGVANGIATLNENGIIPSSQLPSYVDDVLEYESSAEFPVAGESGKIYVDLLTNKTYRWGGSDYVEISESLALGETSSTAYAGNKGKATTDAFNAHAANTDIHVTAAKQAAWDDKADVSYIENNYLKNYIDPTGGHDFVEIAGIKWATMNVGASNVTDTGLYFQWGDTQGYTAEQVGSGSEQKYFGWADYKYGNGASSFNDTEMTKYNSADGKTVLETSDDAVQAYWGDGWRMPTTEEYAALGNAVNTSWTADYQGSGVAGMICIDKTDSSKVLFFPACGYCFLGSISGRTIGYCWQSSLYSSNVKSANLLYFFNGYLFLLGNGSRSFGYPVRGVYVGPESQQVSVSGVTDTEKASWDSKSNFSGSYNDLTDKPTIPTVAQSDWNQTDTTAVDYIKNKPDVGEMGLVTAAAITDLDTRINNITTEVSEYTAGIDLVTAAALTDLNDRIDSKSDFSGSYNDLTDKPVIPAAQVNSDWNQSDSTAVDYIKNKPDIDLITSRERKMDFDLADLKAAVADQNLEKYGLKVGDQKTINGHTYVIADLNPMKGTSTPYRVTVNHVGLIVIPHTTQAWNVSGHTYEGAGNRGAGYMNSDLHYYLKNTLLPLVNTDLGAANLIGHSKLLTNAVDANATNNRHTSSNPGASSGWAWEADCKICALSEVQVYGSVVWSSSGFDTGEACRQLEVFKKYSHTEIFGDEYPWLRDVVSASDAAYADTAGGARYHAASNAFCVAALILFN